MVCILLGYLGAQPPEGIYVIAGRILTFCYFAYFLIVLPLLSAGSRRRGRCRIRSPTTCWRRPAASRADGLDRDRAALRRRAVRRQRAECPRRGSCSDTPPSQKWSFAGPFGKYDRGALQRGLKVYKEVCSTCHGLSYIAFRNLADAGGPGYSVAQAAAFASDYKVKDGPNDAGDMFERPGPAGRLFPVAVPERAGRARGEWRRVAARPVADHQGALLRARLPDVHLSTSSPSSRSRARTMSRPCCRALRTSRRPASRIPEGSYYNKYFPGHAIKMPKPLSDGQVTYDDGSPATVAQYAKDVTTFLMWTAEPHMEARKRLGLQVFVFLIIFAGLMYFTKKKVWANAH